MKGALTSPLRLTHKHQRKIEFRSATRRKVKWKVFRMRKGKFEATGLQVLWRRRKSENLFFFPRLLNSRTWNFYVNSHPKFFLKSFHQKFLLKSFQLLSFLCFHKQKLFCHCFWDFKVAVAFEKDRSKYKNQCGAIFITIATLLIEMHALNFKHKLKWSLSLEIFSINRPRLHANLQLCKILVYMFVLA